MEKAMKPFLPHIKIILYIVVFVVCFGLAIYLFSEGTYKRTPVNSQAQAQASAPAPLTAAWMKVSGTENAYTVGQTINLVVYADSNKMPVTGYDLLFSYDPAYLKVEKVTSLDPTIDVFTFNNPQYISVTGTKKLSISALSAFANTQILSVQFLAKKAGQTPVAIAPQMGRETTKMVDDKANIITPGVEQAMNITIK